MGLNAQEIFGIPITTDSKELILEYIDKYLSKFQIPNSKFQKKSIKPLVIYTPNPEIIAYAQKMPDFKRTVRSAQINLPDGAGVVWACKKLKSVNVERIAGVEFVQELVSVASRKGYTVGLIGGRRGVAVEALECLQKKYKNLKGWAIDGLEIQWSMVNGQWSNKKDIKQFVEKLIVQIRRSNTSIIFVGFGFPKQEFLIDAIINHQSLTINHRPLVLMAVGGAFDYLAGRIPRAPKWMRDRGLEWLFRLIREPYRLKRQLLGARFFWDILHA